MQNANYDTSKVLKKLGYDGIIDDNSEFKTYVAFNSNQIKSVDNLNPTKSDDIRYSLDSNGKTLSSQQQEFFKDSKVRDEQGRLLEVYHGTGTKITEFEKNSKTINGKKLGTGIYFTNNKK